MERRMSLWAYLWHEYGWFVMAVASLLVLVASVEPRPGPSRLELYGRYSWVAGCGATGSLARGER